MTGWKAALAAAGVGGLILAAGYTIPRLGDDDTTPDPTGTAGTGATATTASPDLDATLVCTPALETMCESFGFATAEYRPGDEIEEDEMVLAPALDLPEGVEAGDVVARTPIAFAVWGGEHLQALEAACGAPDLTLECLAPAFGDAFSTFGGPVELGAVRLGVPDPEQSLAGVAAWQAVVNAGANLSLDGASVFAASDDARLLEEIALFGTSRASVIVATEVAIAAQLENVIARSLPRLVVFYPAAGPWLDYVLVSGGSDGANQIADSVREAATQGAFGQFGLRPATGDATDLPDGLGTPGTALPPLDAATRDTLLVAWDAVGG